MEETRRTIQQLEQHLERFERQDPPRHDRRHVDEDDEGINPFHNEDDSSDDSYAYPRRRIHHRNRDGDVRVDVPEFEGRSQGDAFLDWLYTVERIFEFKDYSDDKEGQVGGNQAKGICIPLVGKSQARTGARRTEAYSNMGEDEARTQENIHFGWLQTRQLLEVSQLQAI